MVPVELGRFGIPSFLELLCARPSRRTTEVIARVSSLAGVLYHLPVENIVGIALAAIGRGTGPHSLNRVRKVTVKGRCDWRATIVTDEDARLAGEGIHDGPEVSAGIEGRAEIAP